MRAAIVEDDQRPVCCLVEAHGLTEVPTLLAADASGAVWVRSGEVTEAVSPGLIPRIEGLFQNERLYGTFWV